MSGHKAKKQTKEEALEEAKKQTEKLESVQAEDAKKTAKGSKTAKKGTKKQSKSKKTHKRSQKYSKSIEGFDRSKQYTVEEAISFAKKTSYSKFVGSLELHINTMKKKNQNPFRFTVDLPHGTGKKLNVIVLDEDKINEIAKTKKVNFDIALSTPQMMPKVAKIARILGPKGKMPNPKTGTVTVDTEKTIKELNSGKVEIKEDAQGIIHQIIGKTDWDDKKLVENADKILSEITKNRLKSVTVSATMGVGVKVKI